MSSVTKNQLDVLYADLFSWMTREVTAYMLAGVAALMVLLGLGAILFRPRGVGVMLVVIHGLIGCVFTAVWYNAVTLPPTKYWWAIGLVTLHVVISSTLMFWAAGKPTVKECGVSKQLRNLAIAYALFAFAMLLEAYYVYSYNGVTGAADAWYVLKYLRVLELLVGVLLVLGSTIMSVYLRAKAKPPHRPIEWI